MSHERACSPSFVVGDTGGATATHFLPEEVINAPAWLRLCLSSNECHAALMACEGKGARETKSWQRLNALRRLNSHNEEWKWKERNSWCGSCSTAVLTSEESRAFYYKGGRQVWLSPQRQCTCARPQEEGGVPGVLEGNAEDESVCEAFVIVIMQHKDAPQHAVVASLQHVGNMTNNIFKSSAFFKYFT